MSDADGQMGGQGGDTGKDPGTESNDAPDPVTGNKDDAEPDEKDDPAS